ncbi:TetR/AcrR family transcriptional regulator [Nocardia sp. alder85J]|uniref:TetR/AcrR family transcriptional regulator n=1 Tax=Nocardia sp. alder85J TaxID=2862949 RepID=UPI001CD4FB3B|nr:TetR/AcrR family transcriptional regulator [Nocardia sp. alder85J]MCX4096210.1 TetR/AcrR family transcriptional regulator [Nocardia sp. alder85J]
MSRPPQAATPNVRVRRTRALLREALVELIEERGFERVTVGDLTTRAMVSRAAFYRNYRDKYALVEQIFDEAMAEMTADDADERTPGERWAGFFRHIDAYHRLYRALLGRKGSPWFADRMRTSLAAMTTTGHFPGHTADDLVPTVLAGMFVQSVVWWLEQDRPCPPEEIAARSARLIRAVIESTAD